MLKNDNFFRRELFTWLLHLIVFGACLGLIVIRPYGPNLSYMPGDFVDSRFNNYILEHDFRWVTSQDDSLLNAPFFYPFPLTLAFSDNHLGSMPFYVIFRFLGLNRESAFQAWYMFGLLLNFISVVYVLSKLKLKTMAVWVGAIFFTFGLPALAQESHAQLTFRFGIPLASYSLWQFSQTKRLRQLVAMVFWIVWQFYISIYLGFFLSLLILVLVLCLPFSQARSFPIILRFWPESIRKSWHSSKLWIRVMSLCVITLLIITLIFLFRPYILTLQLYHENTFSRDWTKVSQMLPQIQSYFISDRSILWKHISAELLNNNNVRWEHQLFVGVSVFTMLITGLCWRFQSPNRKMAFLFISAVGVLIVLTLNIKGFSFYKLLWHLPGVNSIRAVSRIILAMMWPIALFISITTDALLRTPRKTYTIPFILLFLGFLVGESVLYNHDSISKAEADLRLQKVREQIPTVLPKEPVLFVYNPKGYPGDLTNLDAMLVAQELGWPVINGYSGNSPYNNIAINECDQVAEKIGYYLDFEKINDKKLFDDLLVRVVEVGPRDCQ